MKYDRLGINDALLQFETDLNRNCCGTRTRAAHAGSNRGDARFVEIAASAPALGQRIRPKLAASVRLKSTCAPPIVTRLFD